jgi:AraC-like DNA-binding protein
LESSNPPTVQKIIPDGFPEIIFHYRDAYKINIGGTWEDQEKQLLAGQIRKYFFLENTGESGMFGIKLKPYAVTQLFGIDMKTIVDTVIPLPAQIRPPLSLVATQLNDGFVVEQIVELCESVLKNIVGTRTNPQNGIEEAIHLISTRNGMVTIQELINHCRLGERQLERLFRKYIGLSPKFYSRVIRFNYIFELYKYDNPDWADIVHQAGFYDQSHFIKNFKAFTGEDPSSYIFENTTLANLFLSKSKGNT